MFVFVFVLVDPVCSSQHRCVTCWKGSSWCCVTSWWATWITPWCTTWSGDSLSSNCTSYTTCWRYTQTISDCTAQVVTSSLTHASSRLSPPVVLSGGGPPVLVLWPGHPGRSVLDSHRAEGEEESAHRRDSSLPYGCALCLYPHWINCGLSYFDKHIK